MSDVVTLNLAKRFATRARPTERVVAVAAMFGIGLEAGRAFTVLDGLTLRLRRGAVVYITGQSGSGKSVLLGEIERRLRRRRGSGRRVLSLAEVAWPEGRALVDCFEQPLDEALGLLSLAGLGDAFLYLRRPGQLSDGQRYRLRLALALAARAEVVLIDEFCSTLDRVTARVIAYQVRRHAARTGTTFVVATAHDDLLDDLRPDVYIEKLFGARVAVFDTKAHQPDPPDRGSGEDPRTHRRVALAQISAGRSVLPDGRAAETVAARRHASRTGKSGFGKPAPEPPARSLPGRRAAAARPTDAPCTVLRDVRIEPAERSAWDELKAFHYRGHTLPPRSHIFAATVPAGGISDLRSQIADGEEPCQGISNARPHIANGEPPDRGLSHLKSQISDGRARRVVGVIVYGFPTLENRLRNYATERRYAAPRGSLRRRATERLNREVRTIARVVVDPQYRGLGLAVRLVRETMPLVGTPYVEALAVMGQVNPFFERAGMVRYDAPSPPGAERLRAVLAHCRIPPAVAGAPTALAARIEHLEPSRRALLRREIGRWLRRYRGSRSSGRRHTSPGIAVDDLRLVARHLYGNPVYYLWRNPQACPPVGAAAATNARSPRLGG